MLKTAGAGLSLSGMERKVRTRKTETVDGLQPPAITELCDPAFARFGKNCQKVYKVLFIITLISWDGRWFQPEDNRVMEPFFSFYEYLILKQFQAEKFVG